MQLKDLVKPLTEQSDEELRERLRVIRHNRSVVRPAAAKHVERAERKTSRRALSAIEKLLGKMSPEERVEFLKKLEQGEQSGPGETQA